MDISRCNVSPRGGNLPLFNELYAAQPVLLQDAKGNWINGAMAGISIHLQPQRQHPPSMADLDNMYVDVGVTSAQEARAGGANDGAAFLLCGSTDVALGWPLRYSHSPAEVIDVRDVEALGKIITAIAREW